MKLKTFLLSGIFAFLGIFSFASAGTINLTSLGSSYSPDSLSDYGSMDYITVDSYDCELDADINGNCDLIINDSEKMLCAVSYAYGSISDNCSSISPVGDLYFYGGDGYFSNISLSYGSNNSGGGSSGEGGGSSGELGGTGVIITGGFTVLSPIITGIFDTLKEFIPYVVYISIGLLLSVIGFIVVKWLLNWLSGKILGKFK